VELMPELKGTLFPWRVADVAAQRFLDRAWCERSADALRALYAGAGGAAERMAAFLLGTAAHKA
jgi:hypothetical protein